MFPSHIFLNLDTTSTSKLRAKLKYDLFQFCSSLREVRWSHLRSSDRSIPEATIVLTDFELAGWSNDGRMWGPRYYLGHHSATDPEIIVKEILRPFVKRIVG